MAKISIPLLSAGLLLLVFLKGVRAQMSGPFSPLSNLLSAICDPWRCFWPAPIAAPVTDA